MNGHRFLTLPTSLKPATLIMIILALIFGGSKKLTAEEDHFTGNWFFYLTMVIQLIFMIVIIALFALEIERLLTCQRDSWPIAEMAYSLIFVICNAINIFIASGWNSDSSNSMPVLCAICCFVLVVFYSLGGFMMFRLWKGFVQSGASQNPTATTQPGNIQGMHPGI